MRFNLIGLIAAATLAALATGCANRTGNMTIAEFCASADHTDYDICKQHRDTENVRTSLGDRISDVFSRTERAQATADQALARNMTCTTHTIRNRTTGSCPEQGYTLTSCVQTRYTNRAGGLAILRQINDSECRFNSRVLEMQVRCCHVGDDTADTTSAEQPPPQQAPAAPTS
ncbi:MAG: hypothetical protein JNJ73_08475 [Hyphomonadaceae bacterium]|nr:hypothetical protein [Hyphomonadaceae bacterium]